jgi:hypothetical protein
MSMGYLLEHLPFKLFFESGGNQLLCQWVVCLSKETKGQSNKMKQVELKNKTGLY